VSRPHRIARDGRELPYPVDGMQEYLVAILDELQALTAVLAPVQTPAQDTETPVPVYLEEPAPAAAEVAAAEAAGAPAADPAPEPGPTQAPKPASPKRTTKSAAKRKPAASKGRK